MLDSNGSVQMSPQAGKGLVRFIPNAQLTMMEQQASPTYAQPQAQLDGLTAHLKKLWGDAKRVKMDIELVMLKCLRQVRGEYDADKLRAIREGGGSELYMRIVAQKVRDAKAWILDIMQPAGDKPWSLDPTPLADLPPIVAEKIQADVLNGVYQMAAMYAAQAGRAPTREEFNLVASQFQNEITEKVTALIQEAAKKSSERMSRKIEDQLVEGNWQSAFREFVEDVCTYPAGFLKGPLLRNKPSMKWTRDMATGKWIPDVSEKLALCFDRISPFDIYPLNNERDLQDVGLFERHKLTRKDLSELIGVPGYKTEAIRAVLADYGRGGLREWLWVDTERAVLQGNTSHIYTSDEGTIDALEFWGTVPGTFLLSWGMDPAMIPDPDKEYNVNAWMIGNHTIKAVVNPNKLGRKPYNKTSYHPTAGSFWGQGIPQIIADVQDVCNATARALVNNMAIASGPQVEVNVDKVQAGANAEDIWPWKVWQTNDSHMTGAPAIRYYQPNLLAEPLMAIFEKFKGQADEHSGVPAYAHGNPKVGGAGDTASGLSMLMTAAARGIKSVIWNIDVDVITPLVTSIYHFNMLYDQDETLKGDITIKARGSSSLIAKEQLAIRRNEFLMATNNPTDMAIIGFEGRKTLLKESIKSLDMPVDKVIPSEQFLPLAGGPGQPGTGGAGPNAQANGTQPQNQQKGAVLDPSGRPSGGKEANNFNRLPS